MLTDIIEMDIQEWPDSSGEDDHGREGGGAGTKAASSNDAKGRREQGKFGVSDSVKDKSGSLKVMNQEFHDKATKLGYEHQDTYKDDWHGGLRSHYYNPGSERTVAIDKAGKWESKRGAWGTKQEGSSSQSFFQQFHKKR